MDHSVVKRLRGEVGDQLAEQRRLDSATGIAPMSGEDERQFARAIISQVLEEYARGEITAGRPPLNAQDEEELAQAGCSRCWRTSRSRTSTSTAATACSSATPTGAR